MYASPAYRHEKEQERKPRVSNDVEKFHDIENARRVSNASPVVRDKSERSAWKTYALIALVAALLVLAAVGTYAGYKALCAKQIGGTTLSDTDTKTESNKDDLDPSIYEDSLDSTDAEDHDSDGECGKVPRPKNLGIGAVNHLNQVTRIQKYINNHFPGRPCYFDPVEHFNWQKKHDLLTMRKDCTNHCGFFQNCLYNAILLDPTSLVDPWLKLMDGPEKLNKANKMKHPSIPGEVGSGKETRPVPDDILDGFKGQDEATRAFKQIFERWEGLDGNNTRLSREQVSLRLGWLIFREFGEQRWAPATRVNEALYDALIRHKGFREYLSWKGVRRQCEVTVLVSGRKSKSLRWGTVVYHQSLSAHDWSKDASKKGWNYYNQNKPNLVIDKGYGYVSAAKEAKYKHGMWSWPKADPLDALPPQKAYYADSVKYGPRANWPYLNR